MSSPSIETTITPRQIATYFDLEACDAYLNLKKKNDNKQHRKNALKIGGISPLHNQQGSKFEQTQLKRIAKNADEVIAPQTKFHSSSVNWPDDYHSSTKKFTNVLSRVNSKPEDYLLVIEQPKFISSISAWNVRGKSDLVLVWSTQNGVEIQVVEIKSSYSDRTAFKIQTATYLLILKEEAPNQDYSFDVEYEGVIISREENNQLPPATSVNDIEAIDVDAIENLVRDFLDTDGTAISATDKSYSDLSVRLSSRCSRCQFQSVCLSRETRERGLGLLQMDVGTQNQLHNNNITDLSELAELIDWSAVQPSGTKAWNFDDDLQFDPAHQSTIETIQQEVDISDLRVLSQRAKAFNKEIDNNPRKASTLRDSSLDPSQIQGSGYGNFPIQDPTILTRNEEDPDDPPYSPDSITKISTSVIHDNVRDCVLALAARVESPGNSNPEFIIEFPHEISFESKQERIDRPLCEEVQVLVSFTRRLIETVVDMAPDPSRHDKEWADDYSSSDIFLHFYFYDRFQLTALIDALRRHSGVSELDTLRSILSLRSALADESDNDQKVYSIIDEELRDRFGMRFFGLGFLQTVGQFSNAGVNPFDWNDLPSHSGPDLTEIFRAVFDLSVESQDLYPGLLPLFRDGLRNVDQDWYFSDTAPFINLHETTVPIEYFYAKHNRLDDISGGQGDGIIDPDTYRYKSSSHSTKISEDDLSALLQQWTSAMSHVESEIGDQAGYDATIEKFPFNQNSLETFTLHRDELSTTVLEYLLMEDEASERELTRYYRSPVDERIRSGKSLGGKALIEIEEGQIQASLLGPDLSNPLSQATSEFPLSISEGDWVVLTPLNNDDPPRELGTDGQILGDRSKIKNSPIGIVDHLNKDSDDLVVNLLGIGFSKESRCVTWHRNLEYVGLRSIPKLIESLIRVFGLEDENDNDTENHEDDGFTMELDDDQLFVLDPMYDNIGGYRASQALDRVQNNDMYHHLATLYQGGTP